MSVFRAPLVASFASTVLFACSGTDTQKPTGSQPIVASADYGLLYVANVDNRSVSRVNVQSGEVTPLEVGLEPTRIARAGDRLFVTLRGERAVAVLLDDGSFREVNRIAVGAEPIGVVASLAQDRVFVASSLSGRIDEIDATSLALLRSFEVGDEPRWLAIHPSGTSLYVASAFRGTLTRIDLETGATTPITVPEQMTADFRDGRTSPMSLRLTGDPAVDPSGEKLAVPAIYVDNNAVVQDGSDVSVPTGGGYDAGRFNPVVVLVPLDGAGVPSGDPIEVVRVAGFDQSGPVVGYPSAVGFAAEGATVLATIEGASSVLAFHSEPDPDPSGILDVFFGKAQADVAFPGGPNFAFRTTLTIRTDAGPRGVSLVSAERAYVYGFLDRAIATIDLSAVEKALDGNSSDEAVPLIAGGNALPTAGRIEVAPLALPADVDLGRRLFYAVGDGRMASSGSGVSCATCHFDGRDDGLVWTFTRGARMTPSLAGKVSSTAPVGWQGQQPSVAADARATSQGLMGGVFMSDSDARAIEIYIDSTRDADLPRSKDDPAAIRGRQIFERADVGCVSCHSGERFSDGLNHTVRGVEMKTRPLKNLVTTAPYSHDGSLPTIESAVLRARDGLEGDTSTLSDSELQDLVAFLETI
ncbi:MAG: c-type cytochrome [Deltaproteobacteria bacterium]|nr:c-type cytochrome [Deltaproteobacteria bacterium]